jgi:hypothetical protein
VLKVELHKQPHYKPCLSSEYELMCQPMDREGLLLGRCERLLRNSRSICPLLREKEDLLERYRQVVLRP